MATTSKVIVQIHERTSTVNMDADLQSRELGFVSSTDAIRFKDNSGTVHTIWMNDSSAPNFSGPVTLQSTLQVDGNVGIGTSSPQSKLHVAGPLATPEITISNGGSIVLLNDPLGIIQFRSDDASTGASGNFGNIAVRNAFNGNWDGSATRRDTYMAFSTSNDDITTEKVRITNEGNVGIGTDSPDGTLHIHEGSAGSVAASSFANTSVFESDDSRGISILGPSASDQNMFFGGPSNSAGSRIQWNNDAALFSFSTNKTSGAIRFRTGLLVEAMRIDSSGNVGIGVTSPLKNLHIASSSPTIRISDNNATTDLETTALVEFYRGESTNRQGYVGYGSAGNEDLYFQNQNTSGGLRLITQNTLRAFVDSAGNVGINDSTPSYKLDVNGTLRATGNITADANVTLSAGSDLIGSSTSDITINTNKFTVAGATGNTLIDGTITAKGNVIIGDGTSTRELLFNTSDVTHPFTTWLNADEYGEITAGVGNSGGLSIKGFSDITTTRGMRIQGAIGSASLTTGVPTVEIVGAMSDGATGLATIPDAKDLIHFSNNSITVVKIYGAGGIRTEDYISVGTTLTVDSTSTFSGDVTLGATADLLGSTTSDILFGDLHWDASAVKLTIVNGGEIETSLLTINDNAVFEKTYSSESLSQALTTSGTDLLDCSNTSFLRVTSSKTTPSNMTVGMEAGTVDGQRLVVLLESGGGGDAVRISDTVALSANIEFCYQKTYWELDINLTNVVASFVWSSDTSTWYQLQYEEPSYTLTGTSNEIDLTSSSAFANTIGLPSTLVTPGTLTVSGATVINDQYTTMQNTGPIVLSMKSDTGNTNTNDDVIIRMFTNGGAAAKWSFGMDDDDSSSFVLASNINVLSPGVNRALRIDNTTHNLIPYGGITLPVSTTGGAFMNNPHGIAPTSPIDGDIWTTTAGLYVRINGTTVGPLS